MSSTEKYPAHHGRANKYDSTYFEIVVSHYKIAKELLTKIKTNGFLRSDGALRDSLEKEEMIIIVFAAMTIEAFFNDYAAACLGDDEFYDNFDKLSIISKFQLIVKFILKIDVDKSQAYYCYLNELVKNRNNIIHTKSIKCSFQGYTKEEIEKFDESDYWDDFLLDDKLTSEEKKEIENNFQRVVNAIKAVREIARFFDLHDENVLAELQFFKNNNLTLLMYEDEVLECLKLIHKDFNIKVRTILR